MVERDDWDRLVLALREIAKKSSDPVSRWIAFEALADTGGSGANLAGIDRPADPEADVAA